MARAPLAEDAALDGESPLGANPADERHARAWVSLAILFLLVVLAYVDRMTIVLMVEPIKHDLGLSDLQISYLQGLAFALCFALAGPPLAWVADHHSRTKVIFWGVFVWSLATVSSGLATQYSHLLAARFMVGIGEAALIPAAFSLLADLFPRRQHALAFGIMAAGASVGGAAALGTGGFLMQLAGPDGGATLPVLGEVRSWQFVFLLTGVPGLAASWLVFLIPDRPVWQEAKSGIQSQPLALTGWIRGNPGFFTAFVLAATMLCAMAYGISSWTPSFLTRSYGLSIAEFAFTLAMIQLFAGLTGYIGGGYVTDRLGQRGVRNAPYVYLYIVAIMLLISSLGAFALRAGPAISFGFIALFHLVLPYTGILAAELQMAAPRHLRSQVIAAVTAIYTLFGMIAGPTSIAFLTDNVFQNACDLAFSMTIVALVYCPMTLGLLFFSRHAALRVIEKTRAIGV